MATISIQTDVELDEPTLVEGLPGVGLVGKIATDHLVEEFDMTYFAGVECDGLPQVSIYEADERGLRPPVRLYADSDRDLVALQSDVPVSPSSASNFSSCVNEWLGNEGGTPIYMSGLPKQKEAGTVPSLYGVGTGTSGQVVDRLDDHGIDRPSERGAISGPTGALLREAAERDLDAVGLVVESDPQFPDPEAARILIEHGIGPLAGVEVTTESLVERAEGIQDQKEQLAQRMGQTDSDESSKAEPLRMFQ